MADVWLEYTIGDSRLSSMFLDVHVLLELDPIQERLNFEIGVKWT